MNDRLEVGSIKNKMFFIAVPLIIVVFLLLVSCDTSVNNTYRTVSPNKAIDDLQSGGFTFTKSSLTLGDIFDYQKYDLSSVLPQSKTLGKFQYVCFLASHTSSEWHKRYHCEDELFPQ